MRSLIMRRISDTILFQASPQSRRMLFLRACAYFYAVVAVSVLSSCGPWRPHKWHYRVTYQRSTGTLVYALLEPSVRIRLINAGSIGKGTKIGSGEVIIAGKGWWQRGSGTFGNIKVTEDYSSGRLRLAFRNTKTDGSASFYIEDNGSKMRFRGKVYKIKKPKGLTIILDGQTMASPREDRAEGQDKPPE